jgi:hypothetical protein
MEYRATDPSLFVYNHTNEDNNTNTDAADLMFNVTDISTDNNNGDIELGTMPSQQQHKHQPQSVYDTTLYATTTAAMVNPTNNRDGYSNSRKSKTQAQNSAQPLARPELIRRGSSCKSALIPCVESGKEEVRVQSAFIRSEHLQAPRTPQERRRRRQGRLWNAKEPALLSSTSTAISSRVKNRKSNNSTNNNSHDIRSTQHSKQGLYMVSSRVMSSNSSLPQSDCLTNDDGGAVPPLQEQYCLQKVAVCFLLV